VIDALRRAENRLMTAVRDPRSTEAIERAPVAFDLRRFAGHRYLLLLTRRRDGREVTTPVWFAVAGERLVIRSGARDPKLLRISNNPAVKVAPCGFRGRPLTAPMLGRARILSGEDERQAESALSAALGWRRRLYSHLREPFLPMVYIEVTPIEPE
jgi:uncharacterized protein